MQNRQRNDVRPIRVFRQANAVSCPAKDATASDQITRSGGFVFQPGRIPNEGVELTFGELHSSEEGILLEIARKTKKPEVESLSEIMSKSSLVPGLALA
uniref:Uncharacterized protein n=1 Tax=Romanomermis culicivorax TaxID=13658 RepID=A0A915HNW9_ROMCU